MTNPSSTSPVGPETAESAEAAAAAETSTTRTRSPLRRRLIKAGLVGDGQYPAALATQYMTREWFARTKVVIAAKVTHPQPTFLGPYLGLGEA